MHSGTVEHGGSCLLAGNELDDVVCGLSGFSRCVTDYATSRKSYRLLRLSKDLCSLIFLNNLILLLANHF
jgi:hypothetical protein